MFNQKKPKRSWLHKQKRKVKNQGAVIGMFLIVRKIEGKNTSWDDQKRGGTLGGRKKSQAVSNARGEEGGLTLGSPEEGRKPRVGEAAHNKKKGF